LKCAIETKAIHFNRTSELNMPFVKGESGNPAGRPPGSRNTRTLLCEAFLENQSEGLTRTLVNLANGGDSTALRLAIDRIMPRAASRPILFPLPRVDSAKAARQAVADVIQGMTTAQLAPREGNEMLRVIERGAKIIATAEAAEAVAREGQPRDIRVSWVDEKEIKIAWKAYWKEQYEAVYGPLPEMPDPEENGFLPPEKAVDEPGAPADQDSADPGATSAPGAAEARDNNENNENNGNNENTTPAARGGGRAAAADVQRARPEPSGTPTARGKRAKRRARARVGGGRLPRGGARSSSE
jgi:hypothetical protein